jgi:acetylornithine deacetylase/succinyl-diaminopimelate desuccinylase-like protein
LRVRVLERLEQLYAIGGGPGANRLGGSAEEDEAHELAAGWMREAGLEVERDAAGNLYGRLRGRRPELPEVWTGSHLDSVPAGGCFDGALGVVGGLEAVERAGQQRRTLTVVAFRDEEGWNGPGCVGSRALCAGGLDPRPAAFVELHIEQGPRLEEADAPLAVVTGIVATAKGEVVFEGREGHAGTTPMAGRSDALVAAAEFVLKLRDAAAAVDGAVATVGQVEVEPGASNVIPARARVSVDVRAPDGERLDAVLAVVPVDLSRTEQVEMAPEPTRALGEQLERLGVPVVQLASGAGHDAGVLAAADVPTAMLFVRSLNGGISHSPDELSAPEDIAQAVAALEGALARLAASVDE